ncbi:unnamed protein product [Caenorhabditis angaria]|uniref:DOMON domain-containing protein n=1 Tax=Caenorhabditis angaria TaxID=860376 RepID=A0A9P1I6H0_9PELO|nr:unnamed protein product [Caenorhabditis angaria]
MKFLLVVLLITIFGANMSNAAKCSVKNGDISSRWQVADGELTMEVTTKNIGNNEWSAVGFGPDMSDLEVVIFEIVENEPKLVTGVTKGYSPPEIDSTPQVKLQSLNYNSNTLVARFSRPVGANSRGHSLTSCGTWNFVTKGVVEDGEIGYHGAAPHVVDICAQKCTQKIFD